MHRLLKNKCRGRVGRGSGYFPLLKKNGHYNNLAWPNCIDPNTVKDREGRLWLVYGSWSGGIFLIELDVETGLPIHPKQDVKNQVDPYFGKKLLGGGHKSIEGPYILYDPQADYYYLFVSFGWLARDGGYQIRLFRSKRWMDRMWIWTDAHFAESITMTHMA